LYSCVKKNAWLVKQSKRVESDIAMLGAISSTADDSPVENKDGEKYQTDCLTFGFTHVVVNWEDNSRFAVCGEVLAIKKYV
jgi:hypothetical protein